METKMSGGVVVVVTEGDSLGAFVGRCRWHPLNKLECGHCKMGGIRPKFRNAALTEWDGTLVERDTLVVGPLIIFFIDRMNTDFVSIYYYPFGD